MQESTNTEFTQEIHDLQLQLNRANEEKRKGLDEVVSLQVLRLLSIEIRTFEPYCSTQNPRPSVVKSAKFMGSV